MKCFGEKSMKSKTKSVLMADRNFGFAEYRIRHRKECYTCMLGCEVIEWWFDEETPSTKPKIVYDFRSCPKI